MRHSHRWNNPTRRQFVKRSFGFSVAAMGANRLIRPQSASAASVLFSIALIPDPQYQAPLCVSGYSAMMQWIITNKVGFNYGGGTLDLNTIAVIGVGDCINTANTAGELSAQNAAWGLLDTAGIPAGSPPGNHDYVGGAGAIVRASLGSNFTSGGFFAPDVRSVQTYWNHTLPTGKGKAIWGGAQDTTGRNWYFKVDTGEGHRKLLFLFMDFFCSTSDWTWAKGIHDANPGYEVIISTHSYTTDAGDLVDRNTGTALAKQYGPDIYDSSGSMAYPNATSSREAWNGTGVTPAAWNLTNWSRLSQIWSGHWVYSASHTGGATNPPWYWTKLDQTSSSYRAQTVRAIFCNLQELENVSSSVWCPGNVLDTSKDVCHVMFLRYMSDATVEAYLLSTATGKFYGDAAAGGGLSTPQLLFSFANPQVPYDSTSAKGGVTMKGVTAH